MRATDLDWALDEPANGERALSIVLPKRQPPGGGAGAAAGARGPIFASLRVCGEDSHVPGLVATAEAE